MCSRIRRVHRRAPFRAVGGPSSCPSWLPYERWLSVTIEYEARHFTNGCSDVPPKPSLAYVLPWDRPLWTEGKMPSVALAGARGRNRVRKRPTPPDFWIVCSRKSNNCATRRWNQPTFSKRFESRPIARQSSLWHSASSTTNAGGSSASMASRCARSFASVSSSRLLRTDSISASRSTNRRRRSACSQAFGATRYTSAIPERGPTPVEPALLRAARANHPALRP